MLANSFFGKEDHGLTNRLLAERSGILNWSIAGYEQLCRNAAFLFSPDSASDAIRDLEDPAPLSALFLRDKCTIEPWAGQLHALEIFEEWKLWCDSQNRGNAGNAPDIRSRYP